MDVGDLVDDFTLPDQHGNDVTLAEMTARGPAVLYFYIKAMTPG